MRVKAMLSGRGQSVRHTFDEIAESTGNLYDMDADVLNEVRRVIRAAGEGDYVSAAELPPTVKDALVVALTHFAQER